MDNAYLTSHCNGTRIHDMLIILSSCWHINGLDNKSFEFQCHMYLMRSLGFAEQPTGRVRGEEWM